MPNEISKVVRMEDLNFGENNITEITGSISETFDLTTQSGYPIFYIFESTGNKRILMLYQNTTVGQYMAKNMDSIKGTIFKLTISRYWIKKRNKYGYKVESCEFVSEKPNIESKSEQSKLIGFDNRGH